MLPINGAATVRELTPRQIYRQVSSLRPLPCLALVIGCTGSGVAPKVPGAIHLRATAWLSFDPFRLLLSYGGLRALFICVTLLNEEVNSMAKKEILDKLSIYIPQKKMKEKPVERLIKLSEKKDRSINYLVVEAIIEYLKREERKA